MLSISLMNYGEIKPGERSQRSKQHFLT